MYRIKLQDEAIRDLSGLDKPTAQRILNRLQWLAENIAGLPREALKGEFADFYKFRVGDYRVLYQVLDDKEFILIHAVGHRREVYHRR